MPDLCTYFNSFKIDTKVLGLNQSKMPKNRKLKSSNIPHYLLISKLDEYPV